MPHIYISVPLLLPSVIAREDVDLPARTVLEPHCMDFVPWNSCTRAQPPTVGISMYHILCIELLLDYCDGRDADMLFQKHPTRPLKERSVIYKETWRCRDSTWTPSILAACLRWWCRFWTSSKTPPPEEKHTQTKALFKKLALPYLQDQLYMFYSFWGWAFWLDGLRE